ncbi:GAF domain-containing protein [Yunchengibacter salinarum]|uniref:GAF domain-containing protein n=1 Tax=Yunchengibacter salinarum TaxID=3133399 RepID=UPI0035B6632A
MNEQNAATVGESERDRLYRQAEEQIMAVLDGEGDRIARMATITCLLRDTFPERYFWTGFYLVAGDNPDELVVGPYQGTMGCLRIPFGRGVCGMAAESRATQVVDDVLALDNHIACDSRSRSEIVVPVMDETGTLIAVLDVDSTDTGAFDDRDRVALERLMRRVFA